MSKKLVVAMSTSGLDYYPDTHNIRILRLNITVGTETFIDGETLKADSFEDWLLKNPTGVVKTSPPLDSMLTRFFMKIADDGYDEVLVITMSSVLSKTYEYVKQLIPVFADKLRIHVFDSKTGTFAEGLMALEAEQCFNKGMDMESTIMRLRKMRQNNTVMFAVSDLRYLINNGRLSQTAGFFANMLSIKPIIQVTPNGEAIVAEKIMSFNRAMSSLSNHLERYLKQGTNHRVYLLYTGSKRENFFEFERIVAENNRLKHLPAYPITPVVSAHAGPNCVGFGIFWE
ncbi:DegV family protein [Wielerella bovis]|uniref:DegV family protein n=1 Tax=Wielerella bovis TaxID=2917790 RepID=UPI00201989F0|nr:DegV family protein [Wielerella bovis]ULJ59452.1 DegV family protein [Wielerella bovis]ULJ63800.1 DegV family protein [Wielerella bovis]ULJ66032.1 DegV family protein [Wielerella bovis]